MSEISRALLFMVSCVFTENVVFSRLLGVGIFKKAHRVENAIGLGLMMAALTTLTALFAWLLDRLLLVPLKVEFLRLPVYVLVMIGLALLALLLAKRIRPELGEALEDSFLPMAANCAVLGIAILNFESGYGLGYALLHGLFGGLGYLLAIVLMAGVQERIEFSRVPESMKGLPITLVSASLMALAFLGFMGMA